MSKTIKKFSVGFTLIETLLYIALFSIIIGGGMIATYQIIEGTDAGKNQVILQEEANFLLRKINWALTGATNISIPSSSTPTNNLVLTKNINGIETALTFNLSGNNLTMKRQSAPAIILNSNSLKVSNLLFTKMPEISGRPDGVITDFTLTTFQNGRNTTQSFSTTKYLRK